MIIRITALLALLVALMGTVWKIYHDLDKSAYNRGRSEVQASWNAAAAAADSHAQLLTQQHALAMEVAQNDHLINLKKVQADATASRSALIGLQRTLSDRTANTARAEPASAADKSAATPSSILGECGAALQDLAAKADGHVADVQMLLSAWPK